MKAARDYASLAENVMNQDSSEALVCAVLAVAAAIKEGGERPPMEEKIG